MLQASGPGCRGGPTVQYSLTERPCDERPSYDSALHRSTGPGTSPAAAGAPLVCGCMTLLTPRSKPLPDHGDFRPESLSWSGLCRPFSLACRRQRLAGDFVVSVGMRWLRCRVSSIGLGSRCACNRVLCHPSSCSCLPGYSKHQEPAFWWPLLKASARAQGSTARGGCPLRWGQVRHGLPVQARTK